MQPSPKHDRTRYPNPARASAVRGEASLVDGCVQVSRGRDQWLMEFAAAGAPAGAIRTLDEVYSVEQTRSQGSAGDFEHTSLWTSYNSLAMLVPSPSVAGAISGR